MTTTDFIATTRRTDRNPRPAQRGRWVGVELPADLYEAILEAGLEPAEAIVTALREVL